MHWLWVFLGGGLGSLVRYSIHVGMSGWQFRFPLATFLANVLACFVLGCVLASLSLGQLPDRYRFLLATGFCGGFSTFSTFTSETWLLAESGRWDLVAANVLGSWLLCLAAFAFGWWCWHKFFG